MPAHAERDGTVRRRARPRLARPRSALVAGLVALLVLATPDLGLAWSNGVDGPNSYGTHDWVLDHGVRGARRGGRWVCRRAALRATDDPDTKDGIDHASATWWHVYDEWGSTWGGAPEAVRVWFRRAARGLSAGRPCAASRALGIMAHMLADVAQPMHTDGWLAAEDRVHGPYEGAVDRRSEPSDRVYRFRNDGVDRVRPYPRTVRLARKAHRSYAKLVRAYARHGYNRTVHRITRRQLNRAANALADLVREIRRRA